MPLQISSNSPLRYGTFDNNGNLIALDPAKFPREYIEPGNRFADGRDRIKPEIAQQIRDTFQNQLGYSKQLSAFIYDLIDKGEDMPGRRSDTLRGALSNINDTGFVLGGHEDVARNFGSWENLGAYLVNGGQLQKIQGRAGQILAPTGPLPSAGSSAPGGAGGYGNQRIGAQGLTQAAQAPQTQRTLSESGQYYKVGNDVFETSSGRHLDLPEFQKLGLNFSLLPEGQNNARTISGGGGTSSPTNLVAQALQSLSDKGLSINPNANFNDPKTVAEFLKLAEAEVAPGFRTQLSIAREQFLRQQGFDTESILRNEEDLQRKYSNQLRDIGEQSAETGFALSGRRQLSEQNLASDTQRQIDESRRQLGFQAGTRARQFASEYGGLLGEPLPSSPTIRAVPRVLAGTPDFQTGTTQDPLYNLSGSVYDQLVGQQEQARRTGVRSLAQYYEQQNRAARSLPV